MNYVQVDLYIGKLMVLLYFDYKDLFLKKLFDDKRFQVIEKKKKYIEYLE